MRPAGALPAERAGDCDVYGQGFGGYKLVEIGEAMGLDSDSTVSSACLAIVLARPYSTTKTVEIWN